MGSVTAFMSSVRNMKVFCTFWSSLVSRRMIRQSMLRARSFFLFSSFFSIMFAFKELRWRNAQFEALKTGLHKTSGWHHDAHVCLSYTVSNWRLISHIICKQKLIFFLLVHFIFMIALTSGDPPEVWRHSPFLCLNSSSSSNLENTKS